MIKHLLLILTILISHLSHAGFVSNTLVYCADQRSIPIRYLKIGQPLVSLDERHHEASSMLISIKSFIVRQTISIRCDGAVIMCHPAQRLYVANKAEWVAARNLSANDTLFTLDHQEIAINSVVINNQPTIVHELSCTKPHTYYVSQYNVLVHNMALEGALSVGQQVLVRHPM